MGDRPVRYYLVGEYGDDTFRAHYHAALFGVSTLDLAPVDTWGYGHVHMGELTLQSAQYIAGYVTKKMTKNDDPRLAGRHPEFARMSRVPGIGALAVSDVAEALNDEHGARLISRLGDVPMSLRHGGRSLPLGRYLRRKLREEMGFETSRGQFKPEQDRKSEMQALYDASGSRKAYLSDKPYVEKVKVRQLLTKSKIWSKKGSI